ncbi:hypothetical protein BOW35_10475 [Solemya velum gill symbiont]|nr:hypothetical protein BOW27_09475 [Solemya velum gill symbiont]OOZ18579.1 hypothetical protein BOW29_09390 [Solemya velum gill symbiont]OOZ21350.1 hypothetical protein BOW30_09985 [Solemya velum gill symbiont]OOZ22207.1 hypothetical protein BOW31_11685 [Solemya velum gill symbiont]OOZ27604.1 hypothetical protein BOW33_11295 [Solemya velum gill symbiont]
MAMKTLKTILIVTLTTLILSACNMGSMMIHEEESHYDYGKTVETIKANAKATGWLVPKVYNFQASMLKHNQPDPGKISVLKLCKPEIAAQMLASDNKKYVSVMMPCSVSVYEKSDGKTYVASMNMGLMSKVMGSEVGPILKRVSEEDAEILSFLKEK